MALLKADKRSEKGSKQVSRLRRQGKVPGIVYGHGLEAVPVTLDLRELTSALTHHERLLELDISGGKENVLVKDVQYDAFQKEVLHIDLARVNLDERVTVTVPVVLRGTPAGAADGGVLTQTLGQIEIECLVTAIPEDVRQAVGEMKIGDVLHAKDLALPQGARLITDGELIIASVALVAEEVAAPAAEGTAEPEVIGGKKEEEEGAEDKK